MLICIVGNISAGKSTTCKELEKLLHDYTYISLDGYRKQYNQQKTVEGEDKAQYEFIKDMCKLDNVIIECTGTGKWWSLYLEKYKINHKSKDILIITLECPKDICVQRTQTKFDLGYQWPPLPDIWQDWFKTRGIPQITVLKNSIDWMNKKIPIGKLIVKTDKLSPNEVAKRIVKLIE